jgi:hypothetical protein
MTRKELVAEVKNVREGIRAHPDSKHLLAPPARQGLLPEKTDPLPHRVQLAGVCPGLYPVSAVT